MHLQICVRRDATGSACRKQAARIAPLNRTPSSLVFTRATHLTICPPQPIPTPRAHPSHCRPQTGGSRGSGHSRWQQQRWDQNHHCRQLPGSRSFCAGPATGLPRTTPNLRCCNHNTQQQHTAWSGGSGRTVHARNETSRPRSTYL